jgi:NAD(P)H-dependent FMN reductase
MNSKYVIISGTNRTDSRSMKIAKQYQQLLAHNKIESELIDLCDINMSQFDINVKSTMLKKIESDVLIPCNKFIFIVPEYNGSFPGVLKLWIDCSDVKNVFWNKKAALIGISDGRNGNLLGLNHFTAVLNYLKINVHHYKITLPQVSKLLNENNQLVDASIMAIMQKQVDEFINF